MRYIVGYMAQKARKSSKKTQSSAQYEPTMVALTVAFVAAVSLVLFAVIALSFR